MATLTLNIYKGKEIEKTYRTDEFDLMFGVIDDLADVIDFNKLNDEKEVAKVVVVVLKQLKPFLKDIFPCITDDEIKRTKVKELVPLFVNIVKFTINELRELTSGNVAGA